jgi:hypothetical protein
MKVLQIIRAFHKHCSNPHWVVAALRATWIILPAYEFFCLITASLNPARRPRHRKVLRSWLRKPRNDHYHSFGVAEADWKDITGEFGTPISVWKNQSMRKLWGYISLPRAKHCFWPSIIEQIVGEWSWSWYHWTSWVLITMPILTMTLRLFSI